MRQGTVCMHVRQNLWKHMRDCSQWVLCMSESLSACVYVLAELQWPGGNGPAEYPSLTLILLPQASPTPTHGDICCCLHITTRTEGHLHAYTYRHVWKKLGGKKTPKNVQPCLNAFFS